MLARSLPHSPIQAMAQPPRDDVRGSSFGARARGASNADRIESRQAFAAEYESETDDAWLQEEETGGEGEDINQDDEYYQQQCHAARKQLLEERALNLEQQHEIEHLRLLVEDLTSERDHLERSRECDADSSFLSLRKEIRNLKAENLNLSGLLRIKVPGGIGKGVHIYCLWEFVRCALVWERCPCSREPQ